MYNETKKAVRKALKVGKLLFPLGAQKFDRLCKAVSGVSPATQEDLTAHIESGMTPHEAVVHEMKERYKKAAEDAGFEGKYGIAMLEYSILMKESKNG